MTTTTTTTAGSPSARANGSPGATTEQVKDLLRLAVRSPSGANGQPWYFEWNERELRVFFAKSRTPRALDPEYRATYALAGCFIECLDIAATSVGLRANITSHLPYESGKPLFTVTFTPTSDPPSPLIETLAHRFTDRREFAGGSMQVPLFRQILDEARGTPCGLYLLDHHPSDLVDYVCDAEGLFRAWDWLHDEHWKWLRWSDEEAKRTRDGIHYKANGMSFGVSRFFKALGTSHDILALAQSKGLLKPLGRRMRGLLTSGAGFVLTTVKSRDIADLVPAGRLMLRTWLMSQKAGYSVHPFVNPSLYLYFRAADCMPEGVPGEYLRLFEKGNHILRREFKIPADELPLVLWRTGLSSGPLSAEMWTLRRHVEDVFRVVP